MKVDLYDLQERNTRLLIRNRDLRSLSWQRLVQECAEEEATLAWSQDMEVRYTTPDLLPQTKERPPYWGIINFARSAMP